jgi:zinc protease
MRQVHKQKSSFSARALLSLIFAFILLNAQFAFANKTMTNNEPPKAKQERIAAVLQPSRSPIISFRILFNTGAAEDPKGKEGLAALTAAMLAAAGSRELEYERIVEAFYPMAASFGAQTDKEMTVFVGATHIDNLQKYYQIIKGMLLDPGFRDTDFARVKTDAINFLKVDLRESNDEELGKEELYRIIYADHPYGHQTTGTISALEKITLEDVRDFYRTHYTQSALTIGLAGNFPTDFPAQMQKDFAKLPVGANRKINIPAPKLESGARIEIIKRDTRSTAISMGFPIDVTRADKDWAALALVASFFGQHRSSNSYLYQRLREARGLNYGDYAYIEYFPRGMFQFTPDPNLARHQQIFQIWIRPVEPQNAHFALRAALYEFDKLVRDGLTPEQFETTREFLSKYANILTQTQDAQLGYALDSRFYGTPEFTTFMREQLAKLTLNDVNRAIRQHLKTDSMRIVIVTKDAESLRDAIVSNKTSPMIYVSPKPQAILDEDKIIENYKINVAPENVTIVPVERVFQ